MMHVVHLTSVHTLLDTRIFYKECQSLKQANYKVSLITVSKSDELIDGIQIYGVRKPDKFIKRIFVTAFQIFQIARKMGADVYHFHDPELIWVGFLLKVLGKKVIYDIHEDLPNQVMHKFYIPYWVRPIVSKGAKSAENLAGRVFDALIAATPTIAERFPPTKTVTVLNFPILKELLMPEAQLYEDRDNLIVYVGVIGLTRGAKEMIEATKILPQSLNAQLILGGSVQPPELQDELKGLAQDKTIKFLGWQSRKEVQNLLGQARIGLVTLHPTQSYLDSYPVKLFEYMAAGIPVVASNFPLWKEIVEKSQCGMLVNPLDPSEIANAIEYLLTHPAEAAEMGKNGQRAVQELFNWEAESKKLIAVYEKLLGRNASEMAT